MGLRTKAFLLCFERERDQEQEHMVAPGVMKEVALGTGSFSVVVVEGPGAQDGDPWLFLGPFWVLSEEELELVHSRR